MQNDSQTVATISQSLKNLLPDLVCANRYMPKLNAQKTEPAIIASITDSSFSLFYPVHGNKRINKKHKRDNAQSDEKINQFLDSYIFLPFFVCTNITAETAIKINVPHITITPSIINSSYLSLLINHNPIYSKKITVPEQMKYNAGFDIIPPRKEDIRNAVATYLATSISHLPSSFIILSSFKHAKVAKIILRKVKIFDEKLADIKNTRIFAASYIQNGGQFRLYAAGFFYALQQTIRGSVPPCRALMRRLPFCRCMTTGQAEPLLFPPQKHFYTMSTVTENAGRVEYLPESTPTERHTVHHSPARPASVTTAGDNNHLIYWRKNPVKVFTGQTADKGNQSAVNRYTDTVIANPYPVENPVSFQLFKFRKSAHGVYFLDANHVFFNSSQQLCIENPVEVFIKNIFEPDCHSLLNDFITCSQLTYLPVRPSSIILPKAASSKVSVSTPSASKRASVFSSSESEERASSTSEKAYSPNRLLDSSRLIRISGFFARFGLFRTATGVAVAVCMTSNFENYAEKVAKIILRKVKIFDEKLADIKKSRIFAPELTLEPSFKAFLPAAFSISAILYNSTGCCLSMGSRCKALLTVPNVREQQSFLFTHIFQ